MIGIKILDVGCGGGLLSEALARLGANITAIDPSKRLIYYLDYNVTIIIINILQLLIY